MKSDTTPAMRDKHRALLAAMAPEERLAACCGMFDAAKALAAAQLADEADPDGLSLCARIFLRFYRRDFSPQECAETVALLDRK